MRKIQSSAIILCVLSALSTACVKVEDVFHSKSKKKSGRVTTETMLVNETIGDKDTKFQVISESSLQIAREKKSILHTNHPSVLEILNKLPQGTGPASDVLKLKTEVRSNNKSTGIRRSLVVGLPIGLVGEQNVFGGVITEVSDSEDENLGTLKLTDLAPIHVRTVINRNRAGAYVVTLLGCPSKCTENSPPLALIDFPIVGFNQEEGMIILDMSAIGNTLDFMRMIDPEGKVTKLKSISSNTVSVDYDLKTLLFDIQTKMVPVTTQDTDTNVKTTDFTTRWYLKLNSSANPAFISRDAAEGVGFFQTTRNSESKITRFSVTGNGFGTGTVKYYIKNVPEEFKKYFSQALDDWNTEFKDLLGNDLLSYEFVDQGDPREKLLVTGDIRYNIIEWDLKNIAAYGGLGPSIANQYSGEIMSANVLVQGPTIVKLYTKWFGVSQEVRELRNQGLAKEANELIKEFHTSIQKDMNARKTTKFKLKLGKSLEMTVHSQRPELEDPMISKEFEIVPAGMTYEEYMKGYMLEIVAHEIGHNLGLRHNFKGNLGAVGNNEPGSVSRSVMEYLGRPFRHLNTIGPYDRMAIAYGYKGAIPLHKDWFCTDEDQGIEELKNYAEKSPECSKGDATHDPFSFWEARLSRSIDLILDTKSSSAPVWTVKEVETQVNETITGLSAYALSAEKTAETWTNFFGKFDRPDNKSEIKSYVLARIKRKICDSQLQEIILAKEDVESQKVAQDNLNELIKMIIEKTTSLELYSADDLKCED